MNKTDFVLISNLRANGRMPLTELAKKSKLPVSTVHCRLQKQMKEKLVKPALLLNYEKMGFGAHAFILLAAQPSERENLVAHLTEHPNVNSLYRINNSWHALFDCVFKDLKALEQFIDNIENLYAIKEKQVHYVLAEIKTETFYANIPSPERVG